MKRIVRVAAVVTAAFLAAGPAAGQAQSTSIPGPGLGATRAELEAKARDLEQAVRNGTSSLEAAQEAARIRQRLAEGDFKLGDRVLLAVEGEKELTDTFTVGAGNVLTLPGIGDVPLTGVLRSELRTYLTRRLAQNLRDPAVRASAYVRLSVQGAVAKPGYYGVSADALLSDAVMAAGGTTQEADLRKLRIERDGRAVWEGKALTQAIAMGRTIDQAGLVAGDQFVIPRRGGTSVGDVLRFGGFLLSIPVTIYTLTRIF